MPRANSLILLFYLLFFSAGAVMGQFIPPEDEAPEALLETELGSTDVELLLTGSWEADLMGSIGYAFPPGAAAFPTTFPGMWSGAPFVQRPDLLLSLWIQQQFFFETSILADYEINSLTMGYVNPGDGFLRSIILGTPGPAISGYGDVTIPQSTKGSFGIAMEAATDSSRHEAMMRIEDLSYREQTFVGGYEVTESSLAPDSFIQGRYYILPDNQLDFLEVYIEAPADTTQAAITDTSGRRYILAPAATYRASTADGTVTFNAPLSARVLVYYEKTVTATALPVGDALLGTGALSGTAGGFPDPSLPSEQYWFEPTGTTVYLGTPLLDYRVSMTTGPDMLLLSEPGQFSPFEHFGWYAAGLDLPDDPWNTTITLSGTPLPYQISPFQPSEFRLYALTPDIRNPSERYPLAAVYPFLYGPNRRSGDPRAISAILLQLLQSGGDMILENPSEDSVVVKRNGFREVGFTVDSSGLLILDRPAAARDRIEVSYRTENSAELARNVSFGLSNSFDVTESVFVYSLLTGLWNVGQNSYSTSPEENPGDVTFGTGIAGRWDGLSASLDTAFSISSPDTTGAYRIFGMEGSDTSYRISQLNIAPASLSSSLPVGPLRGTLLFKDYNLYSATGSTVLGAYDWDDIPVDQVFTYSDGAPTGPYAASEGTDDVPGPLMILEYEIADDRHWVGADVNLARGSTAPDLSKYEGVRFYWKAENQVGETRIHVQIGAVGEDHDGDGILDAETSDYDPGYVFNDFDNGVDLRVGGFDGRPDVAISSEDINGNRVLDTEIAGQIVTRAFESTDSEFPVTAWTPVEIWFSAADRNKLRNASTFRIVVERTGIASSSGRLLSTGPTFLGSAFQADPLAAGSISIAQAPDETLAATFSEINAKFHPLDEEQKVLTFTWSGVNTTTGWTARALSPGTPVSDYRYISFYLRGLDSAAPGIPRVVMEFYNNDIVAASADFEVEKSTEWRLYSLDLQLGTLSVGGVPDTTATVVVATAAEFDALSVSFSGVASGVIALDEIHLTSANIATRFSTDAALTYASELPLLEIDSFPVIGKIGTDLQFRAESSGIESGSSRTTLSSRASISGDIARTLGLEIHGAATWDAGRSDYSAGHVISVPAVPFPVSAKESFDTTVAGETRDFSQEITVSATVPAVGSTDVAAASDFDGEVLVQTWSGKASFFPGYPVSLAANGQIQQSSSNYPTNPTGYFSTLASAAGLIVPWREDAESARNGAADAELSFRSNNVGAELSPGLTYRAGGATSDNFTSGGTLLFQTPFNIPITAERAIGIEPRYTLEFSHATSGSVTESIGDDIRFLFAGLAPRTYLLTGPVYDVFAPALLGNFTLQTTGDTAAVYTPGVSLTVSRGFGSYLSDLFVPSRITALLTRSLVRAEDLVTDMLTGEITLRATALNLFGRLGAYPIMPWYSTDEFAWNLGGSAGFSEANMETYSIVAQQYLLFSGLEKQEFIFDNRLEFFFDGAMTWENDLKTTFSWNTPVENGISLPFLNIAMEKDVYFVHKESFTLKIGSNEVKTTIGHRSELFLSDTGSVSAVLQLGGALESDVWVLGAEGGIQARLRF